MPYPLGYNLDGAVRFRHRDIESETLRRRTLRLQPLPHHHRDASPMRTRRSRSWPVAARPIPVDVPAIETLGFLFSNRPIRVYSLSSPTSTPPGGTHGQLSRSVAGPRWNSGHKPSTARVACGSTGRRIAEPAFSACDVPSSPPGAPCSGARRRTSAGWPW